MLSTSELSLLQAKKEIILYGQQTQKLFGRLNSMLNETNERKFNKQFEKVETGENKSDEMEISIAKYLTKVTEGELSKASSKRVSSMLRIVDEMESIGDSCLNVARAMSRAANTEEKLTSEMKEKIQVMFSLVESALNIMIENLDKHNYDVDKVKTESIEKEINEYRNQLRRENVSAIENDKYSYQIGALYKDIFSESEKMGDYIYDVTTSIVDYVD
jgi:phosphate:Na+ symporter